MELLVGFLLICPTIAKFSVQKTLDVPEIWLFIAKNIVYLVCWAIIAGFIFQIGGRGVGMVVGWLGLIAIQAKFFLEARKQPPT